MIAADWGRVIDQAAGLGVSILQPGLSTELLTRVFPDLQPDQVRPTRLLAALQRSGKSCATR